MDNNFIFKLKIFIKCQNCDMEIEIQIHFLVFLRTGYVYLIKTQRLFPEALSRGIMTMFLTYVYYMEKISNFILKGLIQEALE